MNWIQNKESPFGRAFSDIIFQKLKWKKSCVSLEVNEKFENPATPIVYQPNERRLHIMLTNEKGSLKRDIFWSKYVLIDEMSLQVAEKVERDWKVYARYFTPTVGFRIIEIIVVSF